MWNTDNNSINKTFEIIRISGCWINRGNVAYNMTTYSNDPVRCRLTLDDIWNMTHPHGIDSTFYPSDQPNEFFLKLVASDTNPFSPNEEKYKEDIEKEFERLHIVQDRVREHEPHRHFVTKNNKKNRVIE